MVAVSVLGNEGAYTYGLPMLAWTSARADLSSLFIVAWALCFYVGHALKCGSQRRRGR